MHEHRHGDTLFYRTEGSDQKRNIYFVLTPLFLMLKWPYFNSSANALIEFIKIKIVNHALIRTKRLLIKQRGREYDVRAVPFRSRASFVNFFILHLNGSHILEENV